MLKLVLAEGNKSIIHVKINVSRGPLRVKIDYFVGALLPCTPLVQEKLFRNSIFYVKIVGAQSALNNPWL